MLLLHPRHAEIEQLRITIGHDHNIARFDVSVDDAATMRIIKRVPHLADDAKRRLVVDDGGFRRVKNICKRAAIQPFHDEEIEVVITVEVNKANDVRMYQATAFGCFLLQGA